MPETNTITEAEWVAKGEALFGPDRERWVFRCPICGNEASIVRARAEWPELKGRGWAPHQECIGRYVDVAAAQVKERRGKKTKPCDWCAYGLIGGPWTVVRQGEDGKAVNVHVFAFGAPAAGGAQ